MSEGKPAFGTVLRRFREASGLSQVLLAERAGLSLRGVSDLERGRRTRPRLETVRMLADGLGLDPQDRATLLDARNAPDKTAPPEPVHSRWPPLPIPATSLIGRESEIREIMALLRDEPVRLVTLTGPGGVGKTRIAIETAHRLASAPFDASVFIDLSPVRESELVIPAIASRLGVLEAPGRPLMDAIAVSLHRRSVLMVLDNLEQVIGAATDIADLLRRCPALTILATSRTVLRVAAERVFPIAPLALPDASVPADVPALAGVDAIALFVDRARATDVTFALSEENRAGIVQLVSRLDGLPLAIELAAARTRMYSPQMLLERLEEGRPVLSGGARDAPERQRTMHNAIAWSYGLLSPDEQVIFRRLSIFVGGCTLETAEIVLGADAGIPVGSVAEGLESLVDNSLLQRRDDPVAGARYVMFQTIREFGLEQLAALGEDDEVRNAAHWTWYVELARAAEWLATRSDQVVWLKRIDTELPNLRDHLAWLIARDRIEDALDMSGSLWFFLWIRGYYAVARAQWEELLAHPRSQGRTLARGRALVALGLVSAYQGDTGRSLEVIHEAHDIFRDLGERRYLALSLLCENSTHVFRSDFDRQRAVSEACLAVAKEVGDEYLVQAAMLGIAIADMSRGEMGQFRTAMQDIADAARDLAWPWGQSIAEGNLGLAMSLDGELDAAEELLQSSARISNELGSKQELYVMYLNLADIARWRGDAERAMALSTQALEVARDTGESRGIALSLTFLANFARKDGDLERALTLAKEARATFLEIGDEFSAMKTLDLVAQIAMDLGEPERAAWLLGVSDGALERHGAQRQDPDGDYAALVADLVATLGEPGWRKHWTAGQRHGDASAIERALDVVRRSQSST